MLLPGAGSKPIFPQTLLEKALPSDRDIKRWGSEGTQNLFSWGVRRDWADIGWTKRGSVTGTQYVGPEPSTWDRAILDV